MLEALAALSLASNILSFVDFAVKLTNNASELARSVDGFLATNRDLETYTSKISHLSQSLERQHASSPHSSQYVAAVQDLATLSKNTAEEILQHLRGLKARDSRRWLTNVVHAFRIWRKSGHVGPELEKLDRLQQGVQTYLLAILRFAESPILLHLAYSEVPLMMPNRDEQSDLQWLIREAKDEGQKTMQEVKSNILEAIGSARSSHNEDYHRLHAQLETLVKDGRDVATRLVLRSLAYEHMSARHSRISEAHLNTFEWVFKRQDIHFGSWLESASSHGVFWISGKAGSGKSTLMKFLYEHQKTRDALLTWAGSQEHLAIASHYFWAAGTEKQKSQEGLLRSLLHDILRQRPTWIPLVCPSHIKESFDFGDRDPWSLQELLGAFQKVLQLDSVYSGDDIFKSTRICLFIDGLDEYSGEISEVIGIIQHEAHSQHVKIVLSSREWPVIDEAFRGDGRTMLRLQDLTKGDIEQYVEDNFSKCSKASLLLKGDQRFSVLKNKITEKAQGVFFWVFLVVRSLLEGFNNEDNISILERRLEELPTDLTAYLHRVLDSIPLTYRKDTAQLLLMITDAVKPLRLLSLQGVLNPRDQDRSFKEIEQASLCLDNLTRSLSKQLHARCRDFLEVEFDPGQHRHPISDETRQKSFDFARHTVCFLHSSVKEFLTSSEVKKKLESWIGEPFDPLACICRSHLLWLEMASVHSPRSLNYRDAQQHIHQRVYYCHDIFNYLQNIEVRNGSIPHEIVNELERITTAGNPCILDDSISMDWHPRDAGFDFSLWAFERGLTIYVNERMKVDKNMLTELNWKTYLSWAVIGRPNAPYSSVNQTEEIRRACLSIVQSACNYGKNINTDMGRMSSFPEDLWIKLMHNLYIDQGLIRGNRRVREEVLLLIQTLLEQGADPNTLITNSEIFWCVTGTHAEDTHVKTFDILRMVFFPEEVSVLERAIEEAPKVGF